MPKSQTPGMTTPGATPPDVAAMTYEQARDELTALVRQLEAGLVPLEESLVMWERGEALGRHCEAILTGALARLDSAPLEATAAPGTTGSPGSAEPSQAAP